VRIPGTSRSAGGGGAKSLRAACRRSQIAIQLGGDKVWPRRFGFCSGVRRASHSAQGRHERCCKRGRPRAKNTRWRGVMLEAHARPTRASSIIENDLVPNTRKRTRMPGTQPGIRVLGLLDVSYLRPPLRRPVRFGSLAVRGLLLLPWPRFSFSVTVGNSDFCGSGSPFQRSVDCSSITVS